MAVGQEVLSGTLDVGAVDALESRLAAREADRHGAYADALRDALELNRLYEAAGLGLGVPAQLALVWRCSETRAVRQLSAALLLVELAGALELLDTAVMTVEQSAAVVRSLQPLEPPVREAVWSRVTARLAADVQSGVSRPPARLTELMRTWAVQADADAAIERRRTAEAEGNVLLQRRDDGLVDVQLNGLTVPLAEAVLSRITARAVPFGVYDERSAGKRRLDAAVDLLLGRTGRPAGECAPAGGSPLSDLPLRDVPGGEGDTAGGGPPAGCSGGCGCALGASVPCGAGVTVLVPLATALGVGDVPAQLAGHGPLEPDLLAALMDSGPVLRSCWVDEHGTPVAMGDEVERPRRGDPDEVRAALRRLVQDGPGPVQPRHPDDHPRHPQQPHPGQPLHPEQPRRPGDHQAAESSPPGDRPPDQHAADDHQLDEDPPHGGPPGTHTPDPVLPEAGTDRPTDLPADRGHRPRLLSHAHPADTTGPYRAPARLQRFLAVRSPRCEWPGCGARAARCDLDHDLAWPHGATCACNLGPLCRRHHRVKQLGWIKHRTPSGVRWTGPTGRQVLSPPQHLEVPRRHAGRRPGPTSRLDELSPGEREDALWHADPGDPHFDGLFTDDPGPGGWQRADSLAEQGWWVRELAALRRQVHATPHD